ncbi:uncharacterized protein ACLA_080380 [Aspergillus clavatus NRRL 1]|uniref:Uncharacterized protein n=1 Tax=Aspergillus clavatus (strain ATCC 1007 / CBS 513.65 / DSM 816 / NCTC 3887 / NRRL 1 / QM 1276 / 107) TaxID=344612 RepID=A1CSR7_ASPCL|nr:uncharacterized protein ACLA_080380 [Aspergillus clavatus NRRL 1]EAW06354.1 hypothetical protein ACLA_080380 [Aspergillus clavatus NRRL 1]
MCIDYICKYTICGCIWDDSWERCADRKWCYQHTLVHMECEKMCDPCWLELYYQVTMEVFAGNERVSRLVDELLSFHAGGTKKKTPPQPRVCDAVPPGKRELEEVRVFERWILEEEAEMLRINGPPVVDYMMDSD